MSKNIRCEAVRPSKMTRSAAARYKGTTITFGGSWGCQSWGINSLIRDDVEYLVCNTHNHNDAILQAKPEQDIDKMAEEQIAMFLEVHQHNQQVIHNNTKENTEMSITELYDALVTNNMDFREGTIDEATFRTKDAELVFLIEEHRANETKENTVNNKNTCEICKATYTGEYCPAPHRNNSTRNFSAGPHKPKEGKIYKTPCSQFGCIVKVSGTWQELAASKSRCDEHSNA